MGQNALFRMERSCTSFSQNFERPEMSDPLYGALTAPLGRPSVSVTLGVRLSHGVGGGGGRGGNSEVWIIVTVLVCKWERRWMCDVLIGGKV